MSSETQHLVLFGGRLLLILGFTFFLGMSIRAFSEYFSLPFWVGLGVAIAAAAVAARLGLR